MASGTVYGNQVENWRCYADWWTEETETQVTVYCRPGMQSIAWGFDINGAITATANIGGSRQTASGDFYSDTGATVSKAYLTHSRVYKKETTSFNVDTWGKIENVSGYQSGTSTVNVLIPIPALKSYSITYNANGGTSAPAKQIKYYGIDLTLSSQKPSRNGYTFLGWATSSTGNVAYNPGAKYSSNAPLTLYAKWSANSYTIKYNANGGTGAPGNQTKYHGTDLTLSNVKPTRANYNFVGWSDIVSATTAKFSPGDKYTSNSGITLYAVWSLAYSYPRITNYNVWRCDANGNISDDGVYSKVSFEWATDEDVTSIAIAYFDITDSIESTGTSGTVEKVIGGSFDIESTYKITITVSDSVGSSSVSANLHPINYILDFMPNGSIGFGLPASDDEYGPRANFGIPVTISSCVRGIEGHSNYGDTWQWKLLAKSNKVFNSSGCYGNIHLLGSAGKFENCQYPVDITIPCRMGTESSEAVNVSGIGINCDPFILKDNLRIVVTIDADKKVNVWLVVCKFSTFNLIIMGLDVEIINSDFIVTSSTPNGHKAYFNTGNANNFTNVMGISSSLNYNFGYWGMLCPGWNNTDYIRSSVNGLIPYQSDSTNGYSNLGTSGWPFKNVYTKSATIKKTYVDYISANNTYNDDKRIKFYWGEGTTNPSGFGGSVCAELWSGTLSANASITVKNLYKYNIFIVYLKDVTTPLFCFRQTTTSNESDIAGGGISPYAANYNETYTTNNAGACLMRSTAYNKLTLRNAYVVQQNQNGNLIEARAVVRIVGVI